MTPRDLSPRRWRTRVAVGLAAFGLAAVPLTLSSHHAAASLPCHGYGGQGAGGYISSMAQSCEQYVESIVSPLP